MRRGVVAVAFIVTVEAFLGPSQLRIDDTVSSISGSDDGTTMYAIPREDFPFPQDGLRLMRQRKKVPLPSVQPRFSSISRVLRLVGRQSFYLYIGCIALVVRLPFSLSIPHFISTTLGALGRADFHSARLNILYLFIMGTIDAVLDFWCVVLFGLTSLNIVKCLRVDLFSAILNQDMAYFDSSKSPELASRLSNDCSAVGSDLSWFFRFSIESIVRIAGISTYMFIRSPKLAICVVSIIPIVAIANKKYGDWLRRNAVLVQDALADANTAALEAISCVKTVFSFSSEDLEKMRYNRAIDKLYRCSLQQLYAQGLYYMFISTFLINTCVQALLLWVGMILIEGKQMDTEALIAFMLYQNQLQNEALNLFNSFTSLIKSTGSGEKLFALLDRETPAPGLGSPDMVQGSFSPQLMDINVKNVDFSYPTRSEHCVLRDLCLDIPKGRTLALVGKSGCGKSTIFALLQRFYDPTSGAVFVDGVDLRGLPLSGYRRMISIVQQDPVLLYGSIRDNIAYGYDDASDIDVEDAAKLANAHEFIQSFPEKYNTQVGERGVQLSGGQKQRIAIARALIRKPALLLLDEATSALDLESEKIVQHAIDEFLSKKGEMTVVIIAHRLQTVRNADSIAVIEHGRVVELGNHTVLMSKCGVYRKMVDRASSSGMLDE